LILIVFFEYCFCFLFSGVLESYFLFGTLSARQLVGFKTFPMRETRRKTPFHIISTHFISYQKLWRETHNTTILLSYTAISQTLLLNCKKAKDLPVLKKRECSPKDVHHLFLPC